MTAAASLSIIFSFGEYMSTGKENTVLFVTIKFKSYGNLGHANHTQLLLILHILHFDHVFRKVEEFRKRRIHSDVGSNQVGRQLLQHLPPLPIPHLPVLR